MPQHLITVMWASLPRMASKPVVHHLHPSSGYIANPVARCTRQHGSSSGSDQPVTRASDERCTRLRQAHLPRLAVPLNVHLDRIHLEAPDAIIAPASNTYMYWQVRLRKRQFVSRLP